MSDEGQVDLHTCRMQIDDSIAALSAIRPALTVENIDVKSDDEEAFYWRRDDKVKHTLDWIAGAIDGIAADILLGEVEDWGQPSAQVSLCSCGGLNVSAVDAKRLAEVKVLTMPSKPDWVTADWTPGESF